MNLRNILKIYTLERQLNSDDIALLNTLRGMSESERDLLVESLQGRATSKKSAKKSVSKSSSKSPRAKSLSNAIQGTASRTTTGPTCGICGNVEDHPDHDTDHYLNAHAFEGKLSASSASTARAAGEGS